jgi:hypothetical protein
MGRPLLSRGPVAALGLGAAYGYLARQDAKSGRDAGTLGNFQGWGNRLLAGQAVVGLLLAMRGQQLELAEAMLVGSAYLFSAQASATYLAPKLGQIGSGTGGGPGPGGARVLQLPMRGGAGPAYPQRQETGGVAG